MLSYKPKRHARAAITLEIILFSVIVALAVIAAFQIEYKIISQALLFAVVAGIIYIATRYMIYEYTYTVSDERFEVSRVAGRIPNVLLLVEIDENDLLIKIDGKRDLKKYGVKRIENVCANLAPRDRLYAYITTVNDKKTAILLETDELFSLAVTERINMKKFSKNNDKDDKNEGTED